MVNSIVSATSIAKIFRQFSTSVDVGYLSGAFPEQSLISELPPESRAVVPDQEVVHAIEAFVVARDRAIGG
jgi:hypothetical protein